MKSQSPKEIGVDIYLVGLSEGRRDLYIFVPSLFMNDPAGLRSVF